MFGNRTLTYVSTEGEPAIKQLEVEQNEQVKKKGRKAEPETVTADSAVKKQEEFEAMKKMCIRDRSSTTRLRHSLHYVYTISIRR